MIVPRRRFFILLAIGFAFSLLGFISPAAGGLQYLYYLALMIAAGIDIAMIPRKKDFSVKRTHEKYLSIGAYNPIRFSVTNRSAYRGDIEIRDEYPDEMETIDDRIVFPSAPMSVISASYTLRPLKKGDYSFPGAQMRVSGRMGLIARQYRYELPTEFKVYPNILELRKYLMMFRMNRLEQIGYKRPVHGGENEFDFLREFLPGDNYRKINWKATAKHRYPIIEVDEKEYNRNVFTLIDSGRMMTTRYGDLTKLDYAVDASLILAGAASRKKDFFGLLTFSDKIHTYIKPSRKNRVLNEVLGVLYKVEPDYLRTDYIAAYRYLMHRLRKNSIIFIFSELYDRIVSKDLIRLLQLLSDHHQIYFVSFEESEETARGTTLDEIARRVMQEEQTVEKESVVKELSKTGIKTIRVNAGNIKQKVVNTYLSL
ncbi:MAG: hypothetical protein A2Y33_06770 [Spirochaetes bacterium GWF1_51_8]|nr:MAG: hypothetical protein A2Y33_06770 [Spirochaetes bacterium GWF1_51_8]